MKMCVCVCVFVVKKREVFALFILGRERFGEILLKEIVGGAAKQKRTINVHTKN